MPKVSVVIPTIPGREDMLKRLLSTIPNDYETIVVGDEDLLLAAKRNKGARQASGQYLLFIDDDNYLRDGAIENMLKHFKEATGAMGMVACYSDKKMLVADGGSKRNYLTGFTKGINTNKKIYNINLLRVERIYQVDEVANAFMIRKEVFDDAGGLDEVNFPIDLDEADICKRMKDMGYKIVMNPNAICYHNSQTYSHIPDFRRPMNSYFMARNKVLFQKKHLSKLQYLVYLMIFMPITWAGYMVCLTYRGKAWMCYHFTKGIIEGLSGRKKNRYQ